MHDAVAIAKLMRERLGRIEEFVGEEYVGERDGLRAALRCLSEHVPQTRRLGGARGVRSHHTLEEVRDYATAQQGRFTVAAMCEDLGVPRAKADGFMRDLADQGVVKQLANGRGWKYVPIPKQAAQRQRMAERKPERSEPVPGTGRKARIADEEVRKLVRELEAAGAEVRPDNAGHYAVFHDGRRIDSLPQSPSDHRAVANARHNIRKKMVA